MEIRLPPLTEQRAIADYLDRETAQIDTLIEEQQRLVELARERSRSQVAEQIDGWDLTPLRRGIAELRQGWSPNCEPRATDGVSEWAVLKVGCSNTGAFVPTENKRLPDDETPRAELAVRRGEVIMSRANTKGLVGAAAVVEGDYPRLMLSDLNYGLTTNHLIDPRFLAISINSGLVRHQISAVSKGTSHSMQKISQRDIRELLVPMPSPEQQREIVARVRHLEDGVANLVREAERFIALSRERRAALITAAVTGQIDLGAAA
jgi:type I restriction enzyme S subunit